MTVNYEKYTQKWSYLNDQSVRWAALIGLLGCNWTPPLCSHWLRHVLVYVAWFYLQCINTVDWAACKNAAMAIPVAVNL